MKQPEIWAVVIHSISIVRLSQHQSLPRNFTDTKLYRIISVNFVSPFEYVYISLLGNKMLNSHIQTFARISRDWNMIFCKRNTATKQVEEQNRRTKKKLQTIFSSSNWMYCFGGKKNILIFRCAFNWRSDNCTRARNHHRSKWLVKISEQHQWSSLCNCCARDFYRVYVRMIELRFPINRSQLMGIYVV